MADDSSREVRELVHYELDGAVATITLDSPHNRNALSSRLVTELLDRLRSADADPDARVVVLTHTGSTFCAGADLSEAVSSGRDDVDPVRARGEQLADVLRAIITLDTPVVAHVEGHVRAGGMGLVGACDFVVAGPKSTYALTESRLGLAASVISLVVLPRISDRDASRYFLTGDSFGPDEAARIGLVTEHSEDAGAAVERLCASLAAASPQGLRESKRLLNHELVGSFDANRERVVSQSAALFTSEEATEGMRAFLEKRPPSWAAGAEGRGEGQGGREAGQNGARDGVGDGGRGGVGDGGPDGVGDRSRGGGRQ